MKILVGFTRVRVGTSVEIVQFVKFLQWKTSSGMRFILNWHAQQNGNQTWAMFHAWTLHSVQMITFIPCNQTRLSLLCYILSNVLLSWFTLNRTAQQNGNQKWAMFHVRALHSVQLNAFIPCNQTHFSLLCYIPSVKRAFLLWFFFEKTTLWHNLL